MNDETAKVRKVQVVCDACGWTKKGQAPNEWHNVQCPECSDCIIISDEDMEIVRGVETLMKLGICCEPDDAEAGIKVTIDTATLRRPL